MRRPGRITQKVLRTKRRLKVRFGESAPELTGFTRNLSETGISIETNQVFRPGTGLQLEVETPEQVFELWAIVVWAKRYPPRYAQVMRGGMGCRFVDSSEEWVRFYRRWKSET